MAHQEEQQQQESMDFDSAMAREIQELLDNSMFTGRGRVALNETPGDVSETVPSSSIGTTPDPLNTAFINEETTDVSAPHSQSSLSQQQQQSQTTKETSSTIHGLISTIVEKEVVEQQQHPIIDLRTPAKTMISTGTMPKTPTMKSTGTITMSTMTTSIGTMPRTPSPPPHPATAASVSANETIDLVTPSIPSTIDLISPTPEEIVQLSSLDNDTPTLPPH